MMDSERVATCLAGSSGLADYEYVDAVTWTPAEFQRFQEALYQHEKDFFLVSKEVEKTP